MKISAKHSGRPGCFSFAQNTRANLYKMHKGVFGENVQNSKINP